MRAAPTESSIRERLIDQLFVEAMVLADEARSYFDDCGRAAEAPKEPMARIALSSESLKVTTRLMHVIAWLLAQRTGEGTPDLRDPARRLGGAPVTEAEALASLPGEVRAMIASSIDLHRRAARLDAPDKSVLGQGPARAMLDRLSIAF